MPKLVNPRLESRVYPFHGCDYDQLEDYRHPDYPSHATTLMRWFSRHPDCNYCTYPSSGTFWHVDKERKSIRLVATWEIAVRLGEDSNGDAAFAIASIGDVPQGFVPPDNDEALEELFARAAADAAQHNEFVPALHIERFVR